MMLAGRYDAALLDIYLPGMDGLEVLEQVRVRRCKTPILRARRIELMQFFENSANAEHRAGRELAAGKLRD